MEEEAEEEEEEVVEMGLVRGNERKRIRGGNWGRRSVTIANPPACACVWVGVPVGLAKRSPLALASGARCSAALSGFATFQQRHFATYELFHLLLLLLLSLTSSNCNPLSTKMLFYLRWSLCHRNKSPGHCNVAHITDQRSKARTGPNRLSANFTTKNVSPALIEIFFK